MSTRCTTPACSRPSPTTRPAFTAPKVTVCWAGNASPGTAPVSASTPLGTSTATISPGPVAARCTRAGRRGAQPARAADAHDAVEDEVGAIQPGRVGVAAGRFGGHHPAPRPAQRGQPVRVRLSAGRAARR